MADIEEIAERHYWYQRGEKNEQVHPAFARYGANWPCFWGEELLGSGQGDGSKWACGVRQLRPPCVVYSFGSRQDVKFERGITALKLGCDIHIYDPTSKPPKEAPELGLKFHPVGLGTRDGREALANGAGTMPVSTLATLMRSNGHDHIDILKVDVDYMEFDVMESLSKDGWPSIGQLLLEVHMESETGQGGPNGVSLNRLFKDIEQANFRLFHHELNWEFGATCCIEYSFIQKGWQPDRRKYDMRKAATYKDPPLKTFPLQQHLVRKYLMGREKDP